MPHSSRPMRMLRFALALVFIAAAFPAMAQTNDVVIEEGRPVRELSLQDCLKAALEHNLGLKVARYGSLTARYGLGLAYSAYDPTFSISGQHRFNQSGGGIDQGTGLPNPPRITDANSFNSSLGGELPFTGLQY